MLARRLRTLHTRIDKLGAHIDLFIDDDFTKQYSFATCELADEFLTDLDELQVRSSDAPPGSADAVSGDLVRSSVRTGRASPRKAPPPAAAGIQGQLQA